MTGQQPWSTYFAIFTRWGGNHLLKTQLYVSKMSCQCRQWFIQTFLFFHQTNFIVEILIGTKRSSQQCTLKFDASFLFYLRPYSVSDDVPPMGVRRPVIGNLSSLESTSCNISFDREKRNRAEWKETKKEKNLSIRLRSAYAKGDDVNPSIHSFLDRINQLSYQKNRRWFVDLSSHIGLSTVEIVTRKRKTNFSLSGEQVRLQ